MKREARSRPRPPRALSPLFLSLSLSHRLDDVLDGLGDDAPLGGELLDVLLRKKEGKGEGEGKNEGKRAGGW